MGFFWGEVSVKIFKFIKFKLLFSHLVMSDSDLIDCIPGLPDLYHLPKFAQIHIYWLCYPTILSSATPSSSSQSFPASGSFPMSQLFASVWPKSWSFSCSTSHSSKYSGLIFFKIDWSSAVQGTPKHLLQHHNLKASILWCSAFFMVQISHPYMTTGKTIALTIGTFVGKLMSLLSNMLSRFFIAFLPRSKCFLISWLQSLSAVILEPPKINKTVNCNL